MTFFIAPWRYCDKQEALPRPCPALKGSGKQEFLTQRSREAKAQGKRRWKSWKTNSPQCIKKNPSTLSSLRLCLSPALR